MHLLLNPALQLPRRIGIQLASAWQEETEAGWVAASEVEGHLGAGGAYANTQVSSRLR